MDRHLRPNPSPIASEVHQNIKRTHIKAENGHRTGNLMPGLSSFSRNRKKAKKQSNSRRFSEHTGRNRENVGDVAGAAALPGGVGRSFQRNRADSILLLAVAEEHGEHCGGAVFAGNGRRELGGSSNCECGEEDDDEEWEFGMASE